MCGPGQKILQIKFNSCSFFIIDYSFHLDFFNNHDRLFFFLLLSNSKIFDKLEILFALEYQMTLSSDLGLFTQSNFFSYRRRTIITKPGRNYGTRGPSHHDSPLFSARCFLLMTLRNKIG